MLRWVLATGEQQGSLVAALHNLADVYREKVAELHLALSDPRTKDEAFATR